MSNNGCVYHVHLDGIAVRPDLHFSFSQFDFGQCFVYKAGMRVSSTNLTLTNRGAKDLNVSCLSELDPVFQFDFKQQILPAGKSISPLITFVPREAKCYEQTLHFELNGLTRRRVQLKGCGTQLRLELVDAKTKLIELGTLEIGKESRRKIHLVNKSGTSALFNFVFEPKSSELNADKSQIEISPMHNVHLGPNEVVALDVKFAAKRRVPKFVEDLFVEYCGICVPVCSVRGAALGYNIWLESSTLPFGAITQKCATTKRLLMHNDGDIGASFRWDVHKMAPEFTIYPATGYISAGMQITFDVTLSPGELSADLRKQYVPCFIEGSRPLSLTLTGACVQIVAQKEQHHFETQVRQKESKQIIIWNRTNGQWNLRPIIDGEYFWGLESFSVEANNSSAYEITYSPMTMTSNDKKHVGSVFFPLPDGTGLLYNLSGQANAPKSVAKIQREVPCKTAYTEVVQVENWLKKAQRFKVLFDMVKPDKPDPSTSIKANDYVDVPGNGKKEYKVNFLAHKEGLTIFKLIFKNELTNEYAHYEMAFKAVRAASIGTIDLVTQVRVPVSHWVKLDNPLLTAVTFAATCTNTSEILLANNVTISAKSQGDFNFEFLPLKSGESSAKLEIQSAELGTSVYDLNLKACGAPAEKPLHFKTWLGSSQVQVARFLNFCKQKTDYVCKVSSADFKVDKSVAAVSSTVPSGIEVSFDVTYEPTNLRDCKATLTLTSPIGGEYVIPLCGTCLPPKPQGPFTIKSGTTRPIEFKNVFSSPLNFSFAIDNPLFHVAKQNELIKPHQTHKIMVGFDGNDGPGKADVMAKLVVTAPKSAGVTNNIQWVFYLKGVSN
ncbi:hydrocephalus-inducing -like [Brachionus plicatilis]|uniref:Hydrocephalus-inducing-like n=1 Tax=Brachionus plicatilis TaxID=10195 RepID=A0A3M7P4F5_BRAPC|nr:hydrocephalus-inducing -like [Brachionus plicatilis]